MRRQGARLVPVDEISADDLVRVPANRDVLVKITSHRNMKLFRLLWVLASKVAEACDHLHDREDAMDELKIRVRYVKYITNPITGEVRIVPKSLSKLDGPGLSRLADRMVYVICRDIVPGLSESTLRAEIMSTIEGPNSNSSQPAASSEGAETKPASAPQPRTRAPYQNHRTALPRSPMMCRPASKTSPASACPLGGSAFRPRPWSERAASPRPSPRGRRKRFD
jgi:hypothetical protein